MKAAQADIFIVFVKQGRIIKDYAYVAAIALLIYDYLLTIYAEITLVWYSPWTYTKVLFLLTRYLPMANAYFILYDQLFLNTSADLCPKTFIVNIWLLTFGIISAEIILMVRTWAVWNRDRRIGLILVINLVGGVISSTVGAGLFMDSVTSLPSPYPGFRGCFFSGTVKYLVQSIMTLVVMDAVVLILMMISAYRSYKCGNSPELSNVIHRDAILFYFFMLVCSIQSAIVASFWPGTLT